MYLLTFFDHFQHLLNIIQSKAQQLSMLMSVFNQSSEIWFRFHTLSSYSFSSQHFWCTCTFRPLSWASTPSLYYIVFLLLEESFLVTFSTSLFAFCLPFNPLNTKIVATNFSCSAKFVFVNKKCWVCQGIEAPCNSLVNVLRLYSKVYRLLTAIT